MDDGITYDDENRIHYYHTAFGGTQALHLDDQNRPLQMVDEFGNPTKSVWQDDLLISQENVLGETLKYTYDDWGNVTSAIEPDGAEHAYEYNEQGWLLCYTNPMGAVYSYEYNTCGDVTAITDPEARQTQISYTEFAGVTNTHGQKWHYDFDKGGRVVAEHHYDALDRLVGIDDAKRGQSRFSLNANGQVQAERQQRFVHLFGYDSELNLNQQGFATEYGDSDSNVVSLDDERVKRQSRQYDKAGESQKNV